MGSFLICFLANSACAATPAPASFPCVCWRGGGGELLSWLHGGSAPPCLCACVPALLFIYYLEKGGAGVGGGISEEDVQRAYGMTPTHPPARPHRNRGSGGEPLTAPPVRGAPNAARPPEPPGPWLCAFPAVRGAHTHTHIHADSPNVQRPALSEARHPPPPPHSVRRARRAKAGLAGEAGVRLTQHGVAVAGDHPPRVEHLRTHVYNISLIEYIIFLAVAGDHPPRVEHLRIHSHNIS